MNESSGAERREHERVPIRLRVNFRLMDDEEALDFLEKGDYSGIQVMDHPKAPAVSVENETKDISLGGMSLDGDLTVLGDEPLEKGANLAVELLVPGHMAAVKAIAVVMWSRMSETEKGRAECGLMFKGISDDDLDKVTKLIERLRPK